MEVRQAVIQSIDKDRLVNQVGQKIHTVAYAFTAPGVFGFFDDSDNKLKNLQKFDTTAAMAALKGTTFEGGRNWPKVTLSYNTSDTDIPTGYPDEIARQIKASINMDVALEPLDAKVWNARRFALDLQFLLYRWYQDYPDPHNNYYQVFSIHNKGSARQSYTDPTFDDLTTRAAAETDKAKRLDLYYAGGDSHPDAVRLPADPLAHRQPRYQAVGDEVPEEQAGLHALRHEHLLPVVGLRVRHARQPARSAQVENLTPRPPLHCRNGEGEQGRVGFHGRKANLPQYRSQRHPIGCLWSVCGPNWGFRRQARCAMLTRQDRLPQRAARRKYGATTGRARLMAEHPKYLWLNGKQMNWEDATVHVTDIGWSSVAAVFEGIRGYWNDEREELYVFRLTDHMDRFMRSMKLMRMEPKWDRDELIAACVRLARENECARDTYIRPLAYFGNSTRGAFRGGGDTDILITTNPNPSHLTTGMSQTAGVSSYRRINEDVMPPRVKNLSNYRNSQLASTEARLNGYDTAIILNPAGHVTEGPGACLFFVRDNVVVTPDLTSGILESITRDAFIHTLPRVVRPRSAGAHGRPDGTLRGRRGLLRRDSRRSDARDDD